MKNALFFLIIVCMLYVCCKDKGKESASNPAATTPLEGSWLMPVSGSATGSVRLTFGGSNWAMEENVEIALSSSGYAGTIAEALTITGTFRLDNNQIFVTPKHATETTVTTTTSDPTDPNITTSTPSVDTENKTDAAALSSSPYQLNQETNMGTYAINGNQLTITSTSSGSTSTNTFTKQ